MSQCSDILMYLNQHRAITKRQALRELGCLCLSSRIDELRKAGWPVKTTMVKRKNKRYAQYSLDYGVE